MDNMNGMHQEKIINESLQEDNNLYWQKHDSHLDILKEFYYHNKYILTEQMKDTLLDAINCMEYVIKNQIK